MIIIIISFSLVHHIYNTVSLYSVEEKIASFHGHIIILIADVKLNIILLLYHAVTFEYRIAVIFNSVGLFHMYFHRAQLKTLCYIDSLMKSNTIQTNSTFIFQV